jgi:hypothetical protein
MEDLFNFPHLRIQQPGKLLANRASYEIFNAERKLLATATETQAQTLLKRLSKTMPHTRALTVTAATGEPVLSLIMQGDQWITTLLDPDGNTIGKIRTSGTRRNYRLLDEQDQTIGKVTGDLALKHFSVTSDEHGEFARIRKTWAGLAKEMLTPLDHYRLEFTGPAAGPRRTMTVMMPILLDLTLYGPV